MARAKELNAQGCDERSACVAALAEVRALRWSIDQLKAIAFGATLYGMGRPV